MKLTYNTKQKNAILECLAGRQAQSLTVDGVLELLALISLATRDLILLRHGDSVRLKYYTDRDSAEELACRFTTKSLLNIHSALERCADGLEANGNIRLTLMGLAVELGS